MRRKRSQLGKARAAAHAAPSARARDGIQPKINLFACAQAGQRRETIAEKKKGKRRSGGGHLTGPRPQNQPRQRRLRRPHRPNRLWPRRRRPQHQTGAAPCCAAAATPADCFSSGQARGDFVRPSATVAAKPATATTPGQRPAVATAPPVAVVVKPPVAPPARAPEAAPAPAKPARHHLQRRLFRTFATIVAEAAPAVAAPVAPEPAKAARS